MCSLCVCSVVMARICSCETSKIKGSTIAEVTLIAIALAASITAATLSFQFTNDTINQLTGELHDQVAQNIRHALLEELGGATSGQAATCDFLADEKLNLTVRLGEYLHDDTQQVLRILFS